MRAVAHDLEEFVLLSRRGSAAPAPARSARTSATHRSLESSSDDDAAMVDTAASFDPERVHLSAGVRAALEQQGADALRELRRGLVGTFVERIALTRALERAGARLSRRELRALHEATADGSPGSVNVSHFGLLVAMCGASARRRAHAADVGHVTPAWRRDARLSPRARGSRARPSAVAGAEPAWRAAGAAMAHTLAVGRIKRPLHPVDSMESAVEAVVLRVRAEEAALRTGCGEERRAHARAGRAASCEAQVESAVLRRALADADGAISALLRSSRRPASPARRGASAGGAAGVGPSALDFAHARPDAWAGLCACAEADAVRLASGRASGASRSQLGAPSLEAFIAACGPCATVSSAFDTSALLLPSR